MFKKLNHYYLLGSIQKLVFTFVDFSFIIFYFTGIGYVILASNSSIFDDTQERGTSCNYFEKAEIIYKYEAIFGKYKAGNC